MENTKHTPGPWDISGSSRYGIDIAQAEGAPFTSNSSDVATVNLAATTHEMAQANAHLIAAAPDLLAALDEMTATGGWMPSDERYIRAKAAIAKALGQ